MTYQQGTQPKVAAEIDFAAIEQGIKRTIERLDIRWIVAPVNRDAVARILSSLPQAQCEELEEIFSKHPDIMGKRELALFRALGHARNSLLT